jgi:hypothetical protein
LVWKWTPQNLVVREVFENFETVGKFGEAPQRDVFSTSCAVIEAADIHRHPKRNDIPTNIHYKSNYGDES